MKYKIISIIVVILFITQSLFVESFAEDAKVYKKSLGSSKKIALTFDDGPHPRLTPKILALLDEYDVRATFFVIGENVKNYSEAMRMLSETDHEIGNHTFSHRILKGISLDDIEREVSSCNQLLQENFGINVSLLRPPQGRFDSSLQGLLGDMGYDIILWNIDTRDWEHTPASNIAKNVLGNVSGGDIILMHDYIAGNSPTCDALRIIIPELLERGYEFVTVSELLRDEI